MEIVNVKIEDLKPAEYNPRQMTEKQVNDLTDSIKKFGLVDPIIVNSNPERKNTIIGGHQRCKVAESLGMEEVPVYYIDLDENKEKELNLRLNKNLGEWNFDILANFDMEVLEDVGFDTNDLNLNIDKFEDKDDDAVPEIKEEPKAKLGDIYQLGEHRVMCGDATKIEDVEKLMDGKKADMVFTDPPYGIGYEYNSHKDIEGDEYLEFCNKWFSNLKLISDLIIIFTGWRYNKYWFNKNPYDVFYWIVKNKHSGGKNSHFRNTEPIFMWGRLKKQFNFDYILNDSILRMEGPLAIHACPKPIELLSDFITNGSNKKDIVVDIFLGSGSTLIACEKTNRICYGMELDPKYIDVIIKRWEDYTDKKAIKLNE